MLVASLAIVAALGRPSHEGKRLIKTSEADPGQWVEQGALLAMKKNGVDFMDITDRISFISNKPAAIGENTIKIFKRQNFITLIFQLFQLPCNFRLPSKLFCLI
jgi:hypothetical protein